MQKIGKNAYVNDFTPCWSSSYHFDLHISFKLQQHGLDESAFQRLVAATFHSWLSFISFSRAFLLLLSFLL